MDRWTNLRLTRTTTLLNLFETHGILTNANVRQAQQQLIAMLVWLRMNTATELHLASPMIWAVLLTVHALAIRRGQWEVHQAGAELASDPIALYVLARDSVHQSKMRIQPLGNTKRLQRKTKSFFRIYSKSEASPPLHDAMKRVWWCLPPVVAIRRGMSRPMVSPVLSTVTRTIRRNPTTSTSPTAPTAPTASTASNIPTASSDAITEARIDSAPHATLSSHANILDDNMGLREVWGYMFERV